MGEFQAFGAKHLVGKAKIRHAVAILRIAQNGISHVGAVDAQLVGTSGNGTQGQLGISLQVFQNLKFRDALLAIGTHFPQQTG